MATEFFLKSDSEKFQNIYFFRFSCKSTIIQNCPVSANFVKDILLKQYLTSREVAFGIFGFSKNRITRKILILGILNPMKFLQKFLGSQSRKTLGNKKNTGKSPGIWIRNLGSRIIPFQRRLCFYI